MIEELDKLDEAQISKIGRLVSMLDKSGFDFLTLELGSFRLTVGTGTGNATPSPSAAPALHAPARRDASEASSAPQPAEKPAASGTPRASVASEEGLLEITATTMGTYYARPDPDSDPFVSVGSRVDAETTIGLIEVMKLFNGVVAGVSGTVAEICVEDAQLVEYGQVLVRVRPGA